MALRSIIHPSVHAALPGHFPATCTIQENTPTRDSYGQEIPDWNDLAGHVGLSCAVSEKGSTERRNLWGAYPEAQKLVALAGSYPSITNEHTVVIDGIQYDILAALHDSQSASTYLPIRVVRNAGA